jgi:hypothetical protein
MLHWLFIKKGLWTYGVCAGASFALIALTWGYYRLIPPIVSEYSMTPLIIIGGAAGALQILLAVDDFARAVRDLPGREE